MIMNGEANDIPFGVRFSLLSRCDDSLDKTPFRCALLLLAAAAALAKDPAALNASRPPPGELEGGIPAADIAADGGCKPVNAAGCGIIGNGGP